VSETIKGITVVIGSDTTGLEKALGEVNKRSRDLQGELKQVERLLKLDPRDTVLLAQKQRLLAEAVATTKQKLDSLRAAQKQVDEQFARGDISAGQHRAFQREVAKSEAELKKLEKQLAAAAREAGVLSLALSATHDRLQAVGARLASVGKNLSLHLSAPLIAAGTAVLALAVKAGGLADELMDLHDQTGLNTDSLQEWRHVANLAGVEIDAVAEAVMGLIPRLIQLETEEAQSAKQSTKLAAEAAKVASRLAKLREASNQGVPLHLGPGIDQVRKLGDEAKQGSEEFANLTARAGEITEQLAELDAGSGRLTKQLAKLGLSFADLQAMTPDAMVDELIAALAGMEDPLDRNAVGAKLFGGAWRELAPILAMGEEGIAAARKAAHDLNLVISGEAIAAADKFGREWRGVLESLRAVADSTGTKLCPILSDKLIPLLNEKVVPLVQRFADFVVRLTEGFLKLDPGMQKTVVIATGLAIALGPVLTVLGFMASGLAALLSPIGLVVIAIAAWVAAGVQLWLGWDNIVWALKELWAGFSAWWSEWWDKLAAWVGKAVDKVLAPIRKIIGWVKDALAWLDKLFAGGTTGKAFPAIGAPVGGIKGLAEGGIATRPTLAFIGERGPEAVVPLSRLSVLETLLAKHGSGGLSGANFTFRFGPFYGMTPKDGRDIGQTAGREALRVLRAKGALA